MPTTKTKHIQYDPQTPARRKWFVPVAAAFVVVIALGAASLLLAREGTDAPAIAPAPTVTTPTVTTAVVDEEAVEGAAAATITIEDATAIAESLIAAFNANDFETLNATLSEDASVEFSWLTAVGPPYWASNLEEFETVMRGLLVVGTNIQLAPSGFDILDPGGECSAAEVAGGFAVRCSGVIGGGFFEAGNGEVKDVRVAVEVSETGTVGRFAIRPNLDDRIASTLLNPFFAWVAEFHPEDLERISTPIILPGGVSNGVEDKYGRDPVFSVETAPLIMEYIEEWKLTLP